MAIYPFEIHTPYRMFYTNSVESIIVRLVDGDIGVYANHAFFIAPVCASIIKIKDKEGKELFAFISEGILEVKGHKTVLMVDAAEWPSEINKERAVSAKKKAEEKLASSVLKFELNNAKISLKHAELRLKAAELQNTK
ncbi:MAG: ATP synthase F1 subunit epsilon [Treponema sp.]|jgi:F-type H+-transporting ATPase subunit epsilon|nr:ATP synthase F1 subunit epsilon [Treponema sp.]